MNLPLIVNPEAEADLVDARAWYDGRRAGLGDELLRCIEEVFEVVQRSPESHAKEFGELRLALIRQFPYAVV